MGMNRLAVLILMGCFVTPAIADNLACQRKASEIEQQIEHAREAGNRNRILGLEKALSQVKTHCTDAALIADKKKDIADQQEDIDETQEKQAEGRYEKVKKLERKLQREREELDTLRRELRDIEG